MKVDEVQTKIYCQIPGQLLEFKAWMMYPDKLLLFHWAQVEPVTFYIYLNLAEAFIQSDLQIYSIPQYNVHVFGEPMWGTCEFSHKSPCGFEPRTFFL